MADKLQQLRVFVNERLTAAAEEIFSAVERTILEYRNDIYLSKEDVKHSGLLLLAEGLNRQVQVEVFTAENISLSTFCRDNCIYLDVAVFSHNCVVEEDLSLVYIGNCDNDKLTLFSQEVSVSEAEASTQPTHSADAFPEPQEHRASRDQEKLQDLSQHDAVACFKYEQSMQPSSCCQTQTETSREEELLPISSAEWLKTEEEEDGYGGSETANFWQPLSSDSMDEDDTSDAEFTQRGGSNSCSKTVKSKKRAKQRLLGKALVSPHIEQQQCLLRTPVSANVMMQIQAKAATLPMHLALLTGKKRKRCQCCPNKKDTKTSTVCIKCQKYICKAHTQAFKFCPSCI